MVVRCRVRSMIPKVLLRICSYLKFLLSSRRSGTRQNQQQSEDDREKAMLQYVVQNADKGNAEAVLRAIDEYSQEVWLMNISREKSCILENSVQKFNPKVALELGTYCGYSALRIAQKMTHPASKLVTIESNPAHCAIARAIIEHAGLSNKVRVLEGTLADKVEEVAEVLADEDAHYFDFVFMDHCQKCYLQDFEVMKQKGLIGKGTSLVANDLTVLPAASNFRSYLRSHAQELHTHEYTCRRVDYIPWLRSAMTVSTYQANLPHFIAT